MAFYHPQRQSRHLWNNIKSSHRVSRLGRWLTTLQNLCQPWLLRNIRSCRSTTLRLRRSSLPHSFSVCRELDLWCFKRSQRLVLQYVNSKSTNKEEQISLPVCHFSQVPSNLYHIWTRRSPRQETYGREGRPLPNLQQSFYAQGQYEAAPTDSQEWFW